MNQKQRIAIIFLVLAIFMLVVSLFVRASVNVLSGDDIPMGRSASADAQVNLVILPPGKVDDKNLREEDG